MDPARAQRAIRNGAIAAIASASIPLALTCLRPGEQPWYASLSAFVDFVVFLLLAHALMQRSVLAAALMLGYHLRNRILLFASTGTIGLQSGFLMFILLTWVYLRALQGTWSLRPIQSRGAAPASPHVPWWAYYALPPLLAALGFGLLER